MGLIRWLLVAALLPACGGGDVVAPAQAQERILVTRHLHAILRPSPEGRWYVQSDVDHMPDGVSLTVEQSPTFVRIFFTGAYRYAGAIQVTSDDDFGEIIKGNSNLGLNHATIQVSANGKKIDPASVYQYLPPGGGNFWINVTMMENK